MVCKSQSVIPLNELWDHPSGFDEGLFGVLKGYIDESIKDLDGNKGKIFTLSCLISSGKIWSAVQKDWADCLRAKNDELRKDGRKQIRRYHASDCSTLNEEFSGWSVDEQIEFSKALIAILNRYSFNIHSYGIHLGELVEEIPEVAPNPIGFAYVIIVSYIILDIAEKTLENNQDLIKLFHDRCEYDGALVEAFNHMIGDEILRNRHRFVSFAPEGWEYCIPLQPADLIAYENSKDLERKYFPRRRRKSLEKILSGRVGGDAIHLSREKIRNAVRKTFDELDDYSKEILLINARVKTKSQTRRKSRNKP